MLRQQQAALDLQHSTEDGAYITEEQIDKYLIANYEVDEDEEELILAAQQNYEATKKMIRGASRRPGSFEEAQERKLANPAPVHTGWPLPETEECTFPRTRRGLCVPVNKLFLQQGPKTTNAQSAEITGEGTEGERCEVRKRVWGRNGKTARSKDGVVDNLIHKC